MSVDKGTTYKITLERLDLEHLINALPNSPERDVAKTTIQTARLWYEKAPKFADTTYAEATLGRDL